MNMMPVSLVTNRACSEKKCARQLRALRQLVCEVKGNPLTAIAIMGTPTFYCPRCDGALASYASANRQADVDPEDS